MKKRILAFSLVMAMLMTYSPFAFAEGLDSEGSGVVSGENIEEISTLDDSGEVDLGEESLIEENEQIFSDLVDETDESEDVSEEETAEEKTEAVEEAGQEDTGSEEDNSSEEVVDEPGQVDDEDGETTPDEEENASEEAVEGDTAVSDGDAANEAETTENESITNGETESGEVKEEQTEVKEQRDPEIYRVSDGLRLTRGADGRIAASDITYYNTMGVDMTFIGVEVIPVNGWEMVGNWADFKNMPVNTKEFRLTVDGQTILDFDDDGYIPMNYPIVCLDGEMIDISMELEIGPFRYALNEGLFSFVLVFEEIITEEETLLEETKAENAEEKTEEGTGAEQTEEDLNGEKAIDTSTDTDTETSAENKQEKDTADQEDTVYDVSEDTEIIEGVGDTVYEVDADTEIIDGTLEDTEASEEGEETQGLENKSTAESEETSEEGNEEAEESKEVSEIENEETPSESEEVEESQDDIGSQEMSENLEEAPLETEKTTSAELSLSDRLSSVGSMEGVEITKVFEKAPAIEHNRFEDKVELAPEGLKLVEPKVQEDLGVVEEVVGQN